MARFAPPPETNNSNLGVLTTSAESPAGHFCFEKHPTPYLKNGSCGSRGCHGGPASAFTSQCTDVLRRQAAAQHSLCGLAGAQPEAPSRHTQPRVWVRSSSKTMGCTP